MYAFPIIWIKKIWKHILSINFEGKYGHYFDGGFNNCNTYNRCKCYLAAYHNIIIYIMKTRKYTLSVIKLFILL